MAGADGKCRSGRFHVANHAHPDPERVARQIRKRHVLALDGAESIPRGTGEDGPVLGHGRRGFDCVGAGEITENLIHLARDLRDGGTHRVGVPYRQVPGILASADLIVKMGIAETWAMPVLETFAAGGTAIVGAFRGHQDYIANGANALVVALDDWEGLGHALRRLCDDAPLLAELREGARATAQRLSWEEPFAAVEAAFSTVAGERASGYVAPTPMRDRYRACHQAILNLWLRMV